MLWRFVLISSLGTTLAVSAAAQQQRIKEVARLPGLIAFWSFGQLREGVWQSTCDASTSAQSYPLYLRRIGDERRYTLDSWPYTDAESRIRVDASGPFGHALYFNQGYIYAESPRHSFDGGALDLNGDQPFTLLAWVKFTGTRHMVAGIWDEGGWNKYRGRRQAALFGGLFGRRGVIAHVSASGAASYPQSRAPGSQYARERALSGTDFANNEWTCMAMTFDPAAQEVKAWLNGVAAPLTLGDPVENDVFNNDNLKQANPYLFKWPIYSPRRFILKYNGYNVRTANIYEHWLEVRAQEGKFIYNRSAPEVAAQRCKVSVKVMRGSALLAGSELEAEVAPATQLTLPSSTVIAPGDVISTSLFFWQDEQWAAIGSEIIYPVPEGAPFTLGRALGLGSEPLHHGSQLYIDGVAIFNRVLTAGELQSLTFVDQAQPEPQQGQP